MTATKTTPAKAKPAPAKAKTEVKYDPANLPTTGTLQFRQRGDYKAPLKELAKFAKGNPTNTGHVKALVHLGWFKPEQTNDKSKSPACNIASASGLPAECWTFGEPAAPQIGANLRALAEAGAPAAALDGLWMAYVGA